MSISNSNEKVMVIGTSSERRVEILKKNFANVFTSFITISPDIDEKALRSSDAFELTELIARSKMESVLEKLKDRNPSIKHGVVVTFDQVVVKDGEIREKPTSVEEACRFIRSYSDSNVRTASSYVVYSLDTGKISVGRQESDTYFSKYGEDVIHRVLARGVCMHTAGAFVIEDEDISNHVLRNVGTINAVMGVEPTSVERLIKIVE